MTVSLSWRGEILSSLWLNDRRRNVYSQNGEDGVLEAIFEKIGVHHNPNHRERWCCEFGAHDGLTFSNTAHLSLHWGWSAVLIESDPVLFEKLSASVRVNVKTCLL